MSACVIGRILQHVNGGGVLIAKHLLSTLLHNDMLQTSLVSPDIQDQDGHLTLCCVAPDSSPPIRTSITVGVLLCLREGCHCPNLVSIALMSEPACNTANDSLEVLHCYKMSCMRSICRLPNTRQMQPVRRQTWGFVSCALL